MESTSWTSNKYALASSSADNAVNVTDEKRSNQTGPLPWLNEARCQNEGSRKRSHEFAFDPVLTVTSTDVSFSSTFLKDATDSAVMVSSQTLLDKRPYITAKNEEYVHICSEDDGNSDPSVPINDQSNDISIQGTFVSNIKETSCIVTSKTNTGVTNSFNEADKQMRNSECSSQNIRQQETGISKVIYNSQVEHNSNEMEIIGGSTTDIHLDSAPSCTKKQRKRKHTQVELKFQLISVNQAPLCVSHSGANVINSPCPCRELTNDIDAPSTSNGCTNQRGREFNVEKFFASRADSNREKIIIKNAENYLYEIRQPSILCKPSLDRYSRDRVSPLAEGYKLQDGVYKIPCLTDGSNADKSYYWEESLNRSLISKKSKTVPLAQQQNVGCLTSHHVPGQLAMLSAPRFVSATDTNIERQKSTTEIINEIGGLHLNDRALQASSSFSSSSSSSSSPSSSLSIINKDCLHKESHTISKKTVSHKKPYKSNPKSKSIINSRNSERLTDIKKLAQRIENMSTLDSLEQLTASTSLDKNKVRHDNKRPVQSKPKVMMIETPKQLPINSTVFLERLKGVNSDIPFKLSRMYGLDRDEDPSNYPVPPKSKQSKGDDEFVNLNNSSSQKINTEFNECGTAEDKLKKEVTKEAAVTEGLSFKVDKDKVVSMVKTMCLHTSASNTGLHARPARLLENTSRQGSGENPRQLEKLCSKFVCEPNVATTTTETNVMPGNANTHNTDDFSIFRSKHIVTAVIVNKEDINSEEITCMSDSTEVTVETTNRKSNISSSTVHALGGSENNKQSNIKDNILVPQITKRKDRTASVPVPLTPHIYRYLVENAGVVVKPLIPPASRTGTNQIIETFRINHKRNVYNPIDSKCSIPMKTTTASKLAKAANIIIGNIVNKPPLVTMNIGDHSYTKPSVCGNSNILTTLKYSSLATQSIPLMETDCCSKVQKNLNVCASAGTLMKQEKDKYTYLPCLSKLSPLSSEVENTSFTKTVLNNTVAKQEQTIKRTTSLYIGNDETKVVNIQPESIISKVQTFFSSIKVQVEPYALKCGERMFLITMPVKSSDQRLSAALLHEQVSIPQILPETVFDRLKSVTDESTKPRRKQGLKNGDKNSTRKNIHALKMLQKMTVVLPKYPGKMEKFVNALVLRSIEPTTISVDKTFKKKSSTNQCSIQDDVKHLFTLENLNVSERKHAASMMTVSGNNESHCRSSLSVVKIVQIFKESEAECRFYMQYISVKLTPGPSQGYHRWFQYSDYPCRIYFHFKVRDEITHIDIESSRPGFYLISGARADDFPSENNSINVILNPYPPCLHNLPDGSMAIAIGKLVLSKDLPEGVEEKKSKCLTTCQGIINVLQMVLDKENFKDLFNLVDSRYKTDHSKDLSPKVAASKFYGPELFDHFTPRRLRKGKTSRKARQQAKEADTNSNSQVSSHADLPKVVVRTSSN